MERLQLEVGCLKPKDDIIVLASTVEELQELVTRLEQASKRCIKDKRRQNQDDGK